MSGARGDLSSALVFQLDSMQLFFKTYKKSLGAIGGVILLVLLFSLFTSSKKHFLIQAVNKKSYHFVRNTLATEKIAYTEKNRSFYLKNGDQKTHEVLRTIFTKEFSGDDYQFILSEQRPGNEGHLRAYYKKLLKISTLLNKHLKYEITGKIIGREQGRDIFKTSVNVKDVLKRDRIENLNQLYRSSLLPITSIEIEYFNDRSESIKKNTYGVVEEIKPLKRRVESQILKVLDPIFDNEKTFVSIDFVSEKKLQIGVLFRGENTLDQLEKDKLRETIVSKIKKSFKLHASVDIKTINNLAYLESKQDQGTQDLFLYLLSFTMIFVFGYLIVSIYLKNRNKVKRYAQAEKVAKKKKLHDQQLYSDFKQSCELIEGEFYNKSSFSAQSIVRFIKEGASIESEGESFSSGEVVAAVIAFCDKTARSFVEKELGHFLVKRIAAFSEHENVKSLTLTQKVEIAKDFSNYLHSENRILEFSVDQSRKGSISQSWYQNHYVELIKSHAKLKNYKQLVHFFTNENPVMTSLIFVSLPERLQEEIWEILDFESKQKITLGLIAEQEISTQTLERVYNCFKNVG